MKLTVNILLVILVCGLSLHAQAPDTVWTKTYSAPAGAIAVSIVPAQDGGYFVGGTIYHETSKDAESWNYSDFWVLRIDEQGDTLWTHTYGDVLWSEQLEELTATADGGFILAGTRIQEKADDQMYVVKTDAEGEIQWEKVYTTEKSFAQVVGIDQLVSNDFVLAYNTYGNAEDFVTMQIYGGWGDDLEGAGDVEFRVNYNWALSDWVGGMTATSDKGFAVCGWTTSYSIIHEDLFVMKSNEFGIVEWTRSYDAPAATEPRGIKQTIDGGFIIVGRAKEPVNSESDGLYLLKIDAAGEKEWSRSYDGSSGLDVIELTDGGFLATGWQGYTLRVNPDGNDIWSGNYIFGQGATFSAVTAPEGGYLLAGWRSAENDLLEVYIVKLAPEGIITDVGDPENLPATEILSQNYPNPFNPTTTIEYAVQQRSNVSLEIYNILGQKVQTLVNEEKPAGKYEITWDGTDRNGQKVATGVYLYRLQTGDIVRTKKLLMLK